MILSRPFIWLAVFMSVLAMGGLGGCGSSQIFRPMSAYPPDPWVKGYSDPDDCLGGEDLAARKFDLPQYPKSAFRKGRQGWAIIRLDVSALGQTENVRIERAVPDGLFNKASRLAVEMWEFEPPQTGRLSNCRILLRYRAGRVSLG